ncbi:MAG TPA: SHOCT domain-containing protein [Gaiellales bacterium]|nr:SHOCT domain-containing protein [Gaiellales bacterium]
MAVSVLLEKGTRMTLLSLGEFLWSLLVIFFMVIYFMMLFQVIVDVFRRHDASGGKKALWLIFLFVAPFIGLIAYMITNSEGMAQRSVSEADAYARARVGRSSTEQIQEAKQLLDSGAITNEEYQQLKAQALT